MSERNGPSINRLEHELPEGLLVDAAWLEQRGYYGSLRKKYVDSGWLEQPARRVYCRPLRGHRLSWQQVVISLQTLLGIPLILGGRSALEQRGYGHYLTHEQSEVHLYGRSKLPTWLADLPMGTRFIHHNSERLFRNDPIARGLGSLAVNVQTGAAVDRTVLRGGGVEMLEWGQWDWPLTLSSPERAILELLDELPDHESFHQVDMLMEGLTNLRPRLLQKVLADCRSVKVKRLFFFFADRHQHTWLKRLDRAAIDLGSGKRMLVRGGRLDPVYQITVPEDLHAVP